MTATIEISEGDSLIGIQIVERITSLSRSTIQRNMKLGRFPNAVQITPGRVGWRQSEILAWLANPLDWGDPVNF